MRFLRVLMNIILAIIVLIGSAFTLASGYCSVAADAWEYEAPVQAGREETWLQVNGQPVHLTVAGPETGTAMVLIHGSDVEGGLSFSDNIKILGLSGLRVIAIDFPGFGFSTRDISLGYMAADQTRLLKQVLNALDIHDVILVGFQRGAVVALGYALEYSQDVKQIALISPLVYQDARPLSSTLAGTPGVGKALVWARNAGPLLAWTRKAGYADPTFFTDTRRENILAATHITGTTAFHLAWMRDKRKDTIDGNADLSLQKPVLILVGEEDKSGSLREAQKLTNSLPDAKLVTLAKAGYYVHQEAAREVNQRLIQLGLHGIR